MIQVQAQAKQDVEWVSMPWEPVATMRRGPARTTIKRATEVTNVRTYL